MKMSTNTGGTWIPLNKLVDITLSGCRSILSLPMVWKLPLLRDLVLCDMDSLTSLSSFVSLGSSEPVSQSLRKLELRRMKRLEKWTDAATNSSTMISPVLKMLSIEDCPKIILLDEDYPHPLVKLEIYGCKNLESIRSLQGLTSLVKLHIENCTNLESIRSLQGLTSLEHLEIIFCSSLLGIPDLHNQGGSLRELEIGSCDKLTSLPGGIDSLTSLEILNINDCPSLLGIPDLHNLGGSLRELVIYNCCKLTSLPGGMDGLTLLRRLSLGRFSKELDCFPSLKGIEKLRSSNLRDLWLYGCHHWETIPEEVKHLTSLEILRILDFGIREIPMWLTNMSSIKCIDFYKCPGLDADSVLKGAPTEAEIVWLNDKSLR
ncbi:CC-NBS-LRR resistance protein [Tanacetum coccineum]